MKQLHWLQVQERIEYKTAVLIYQFVHGEAPEYLNNLIDMEHNHYLRSTVKKQLPVSISKTPQVHNSSFSIAGPRIWNALPFHVKDSQTVQRFKSKLKTYLFSKSY